MASKIILYTLTSNNCNLRYARRILIVEESPRQKPNTHGREVARRYGPRLEKHLLVKVVAFHCQPADHLAMSKRQVRHGTGCLYARQCAESVEQVSVKGDLPFGLGVSFVQGKTHGDR